MRVSVVTGGGRGTGRAIAHALGGPGTLVAVAGRTTSHLESAVLDLERLGAGRWRCRWMSRTRCRWRLPPASCGTSWITSTCS